MSLDAPSGVEAALQNVLLRFWEEHLHKFKPLTEPDLDDALGLNIPTDNLTGLSSHVEVVDLGIEDAWLKLSARFTLNLSEGSNLGPWNRCLTILRSHKALTCIIERHYVCLDYKSEVLAFYSQLDKRPASSTARLHFFRQMIPVDDAHRMSDLQRESYLGYIVVRGGSMPLVGRTALLPPAYVGQCATIEESVHLLGQNLVVNAAPFIQQDTRAAVCSNVALWVTQYMAHRRGFIQRKLVADVGIPTNGVSHSLRPNSSTGLRIDDVVEVLRRAGMRGVRYDPPIYGVGQMQPTPSALNSEIEHWAIVALLDLEEKMAANWADIVERNKLSLEADSVQFVLDLVRFVAANEIAGKCRTATQVLIDTVLATLFEYYLSSRFPIYCETSDHAMVLVGIRADGHIRTFFVHDDQYGPYLALSSLVLGSESELQSQSPSTNASWSDTMTRTIINRGDEPSDLPDRRDESAEAGKAQFDQDEQRAVRAFVVPLPARMFLDPVVATADALRLVQRANQTTVASSQSATGDRSEKPLSMVTRTSILMGVDYKAQRCRGLGHHPDSQRKLGGLHLSEWVVVVEGMAELTTHSQNVEWEIVYDASAGGSPRIQFARFANRVLSNHPLAQLAEASLLEASSCLPLVIASKIGKSG